MDDSITENILPVLHETADQLAVVLKGWESRPISALWEANDMSQLIAARLTERQWRVVRLAVRYLVNELETGAGNTGPHD